MDVDSRYFLSVAGGRLRYPFRHVDDHPQQSFGVAIGGILPIEEFAFFLLTTALVVIGMTLMLARPSHERIVRPFSSF